MNSADRPESDYVPINCDIHSQYELACLRRRPVRLMWTAGNIVYDQVVVPIDVQTVSHSEFLLIRLAAGTEERIRLDHIRRMSPA